MGWGTVRMVEMRSICGHCNTSFPGIGSAFMIWCKVDELYVCEKCWIEQCKGGHGKGFRNQGWNPITQSLLISVFIGLLVGAGFAPIYDVYLHGGWDDLERTPISNIEDGETVRLDGIINASEGMVAIGGHEKRSGKDNYYWEWNENDEFVLTDPSGSVLVSTKGFYEIETAPHAAPNRKKTDGRVYKGGDEIIVIGNAEQRGNETVVHLKWVGTSEDDIPPTLISMFAVGMIIVALITGSILILWAFHSFITIHEKSEMFYYLLPIAQALFFIVFPIRSYLEQNWIKPDLIAVSEYGIHYHHDNPLIRSFKIEFIPWNVITSLGMMNIGSKRGWMIKLQNGTKMRLMNLTLENRKYLSSEFERYRESIGV